MQSHFVDIDELVLRCRDDEARKYISEAIACYKAGAFRACVVTTWVAVVYDFIYKLRELSVEGDGKAIDKLNEQETAVKHAIDHDDHSKELDFERSVLKCARDDFEFITNNEFVELNRLWEDRHRCAHPSVSTDATIYQPTPEQVRYHLRNAVLCLLQHPPRSRKDYHKTLIQQTTMSTFPSKVDDALVYYNGVHFDRTPEKSIKDFAQAMTKGLLVEDFSKVQRERTVAALKAIRRIRSDIVETVIRDDFPKVAERHSTDESTVRMINFLYDIPDTFQYMTEPMKIRLKNYISNTNEFSQLDAMATAVDYAIDVPELKEVADEKLDEASSSLLVRLARRNQRDEYVKALMKVYTESSDFNVVNLVAQEFIIPAIAENRFELDEYVPQIFNEYVISRVVRDSNSFSGIVRALAESSSFSEPLRQNLKADYPRVWSDYEYILEPTNKEEGD